MFKLTLLFGPFILSAAIRMLWGVNWQSLALVFVILPLGSVVIVATWLDPRIPSAALPGAAYLGMALISVGVGFVAGKLLSDAGR